MKLDFESYSKKVSGCFIGKSVGGTLGMKYEGDRNVHEITFYDPIPDKMLPNDDLDLQVVNLETILRTGLPVCRYHIGEIWKHHLDDSAPDEYGVAVSNHAQKLYAPLSGQYRNKFFCGMGGAIRSELWACLAPANPRLAAMMAREDACTDHTDDGLYAEMFLAALESAAFCESNLRKLIDIGLEFVPHGNRLRSAFDDILVWWDTIGDIMSVREKILEKYYVDNWTDVTINLSFIFLSLLSCENSFDKAICTAVSLGYDTDCTAATVGSIFGIINPDSIDKKWTDPIGDNLVLSDCIINMHEMGTINDFCKKIISIAYEVQKCYSTDVEIGTAPADFEKVKLAPQWTDNVKAVYDWKDNSRESLVCLNPIMVSVIYPDEISALPDITASYALKLVNNSDTKISGNVKLYAPDGWSVKCDNESISLDGYGECVIPFKVAVPAPRRRTLLNLLTMNFTLNGMKFTVEASLPLSNPWRVTDLKTGNTDTVETRDIYFNVPEGAYSYKTLIKATADKQVRISAGGTRAFDLYVNGNKLYSGDASFYIPTFHRDDSWVLADLVTGENEIEVVFPDGGEGEFFFGFGTIYGCALWINSLERYI
ncbi:MAG: ADP-ribosylglycohydrolase family protein [Clostridia bacterium]|nr:ADP-ribosylglycohydrolase family protein [Clostridia bacterium]